MTYYLWLTEQLPAYYLVNYETEELIFQVFSQIRKQHGILKITHVWNRLYY